MRDLLEEMGQFRARAGVLPKVARLMWDASGWWTVLWCAALVLAGVLPVALMQLIKRLVDQLAANAHPPYAWQTAQPLLIAGFLIGGAILLMEYLQGALEWLRAMQTELLQDRISALVQEKSTEVDLAFYESPECYDKLFRARDEAQTRPPALLDSVASLVQNGVSLVLLAAVIGFYSPWLLVAMGLSLVPAFSIVARYNWLTHQWWNRTTPERRWIQYYDLKFASAAAAPELRLFRLGAPFRAAYQALRARLRRERLDLIERQTRARMLAALVGLAVSGATVGWMAWRVIRGAASLGDLALFYQAFSGGQNIVRMLTASLGQAFTSVLHLDELFRFLELKPAILDPRAPVPAPETIQRGVEFEHVTFRYPDTERVALQDLSLKIPAGRVVAIVGPNGAGKSTLVKLLCRFYDPAAGRITVDGIDVRDFAVEDARALCSVLFQLPLPLDAKAFENIAPGQEVDAADPRIRAAATAAGAHDVIARLPNGYETPLGKAFAEGNDLSAGEWQRVAMARAFYRQSPLVLLDEPTSFMDPWAEADWFARLRALTRGRTAMVVTHRFTIAMRADLIHVLDRGRLVESGSHAELLAHGGLYATSWREQMSARPGEPELAAVS